LEVNDWENKKRFLENPHSFLQDLDRHKNVVISWGFQPFEDVDAIRSLINDGFRLFWFDGDREKAARAFLDRDCHDPIAKVRFWAQVGAIDESDIVNTLKPKIIDVFNMHGFKSTALVSFGLRNPFPNLPLERLKGLLVQHLAIPASPQR
jgi:hypothetical protein